MMDISDVLTLMINFSILVIAILKFHDHDQG
ncbi:putative holin-like toxin [Halobacillus sp. A1]|nr:putative holin-like toxin [Halobacillus sp. A1]MCP3032067.1 putative holin-like toxin [Halobacillus sp. A1]